MRYAILLTLLATVGCTENPDVCRSRCEELLPPVVVLPPPTHARDVLEATGEGERHKSPAIAPADLDAVVRTVIGEVRGQDSDREIAAVVHVVFNRWKRGDWGSTLSSVVHFKAKGYHAFSCWNYDDPSFELVSSPGVADLADFGRLKRIVTYVLINRLNGILKDPTGGATHYFHPKAMVPANSLPKWARHYERRVKIGEAWFYRLS